MKKAVVFGASGLIGSYLLQQLLNSADYEQVIIVVRKKLDINHPKLQIVLGDYNTLSELKNHIAADDIFIALGTTKKKTPQQDAYYKIDHDYPVLAASLAKELGAKSIFIVTAIGANVNSTIFYSKTKGATERDIIALDFEHTHIFRPSMLIGTRKEARPLERLFIKIWPLLNFMLLGNVLKKYRSIHAKDVAVAMANAAKKSSEKLKIYYWQEMHDLLQF
jgi:uncharacterized protein YbjT (DUF2867 family)